MVSVLGKPWKLKIYKTLIKNKLFKYYFRILSYNIKNSYN